MALRADHLPFEATARGARASLTIRRAALWGLLVSKVLAGWGVQWDIQWHVLIGRDSFWIPPHLMTYAGVALAVLLSFGVLLRETLTNAAPNGLAPSVRLLGLRGTRGFHLAAWGIGLTVLAAPIDDLWHRLFGLDVTLWSPPHLLGILGSAMNSLACLLIAGEVYPARRGGRWAAIILFGAMLYGNLHLVVEPSNLVAYRHGGALFYTLAILSAVVLPLALVTTARLSDLRWSPVLIVLVVIPIGMVGAAIAQAGFGALQPVPVIEEEIATDPTSPIALAYTIARKDGLVPGGTGGTRHAAALLPAVMMAAVDPRRRPLAATVAYAIVLFAVLGWLLSHRPSLAPMAPGSLDTAVAFGLTLVAATVGGSLARWVSDGLAGSTAPSTMRA